MAEVAGALGWSRTMAARWLRLAEDVIVRLPALHLVLRAGTVDEVKVRTVAEQTRDMPDDLARAVTEQVLPHAAGLIVHDLIELIDVDPPPPADAPLWPPARDVVRPGGPAREPVVGAHHPRPPRPGPDDPADF